MLDSLYVLSDCLGVMTKKTFFHPRIHSIVNILIVCSGKLIYNAVLTKTFVTNSSTLTPNCLTTNSQQMVSTLNSHLISSLFPPTLPYSFYISIAFYFPRKDVSSKRFYSLLTVPLGATNRILTRRFTYVVTIMIYVIGTCALSFLKCPLAFQVGICRSMLQLSCQFLCT